MRLMFSSPPVNMCAVSPIAVISTESASWLSVTDVTWSDKSTELMVTETSVSTI